MTAVAEAQVFICQRVNHLQKMDAALEAGAPSVKDWLSWPQSILVRLKVLNKYVLFIL